MVDALSARGNRGISPGRTPGFGVRFIRRPYHLRVQSRGPNVPGARRGEHENSRRQARTRARRRSTDKWARRACAQAGPECGDGSWRAMPVRYVTFNARIDAKRYRQLLARPILPRGQIRLEVEREHIAHCISHCGTGGDRRTTRCGSYPKSHLAEAWWQARGSNPAARCAVQANAPGPFLSRAEYRLTGGCCGSESNGWRGPASVVRFGC